MRTMKPYELTGHTLSWAVNECEYRRLQERGSVVKCWLMDDHRAGCVRPLSELTALEIIERERIALDPDHALGWWAGKGSGTPMFQRVGMTGSTAIEAAMRYYAYQTLGSDIEIPDSITPV